MPPVDTPQIPEGEDTYSPPDLDERLREAGIPALRKGDIVNRRMRKDFGTQFAEAAFFLYGDKDYVIMSYVTEIHEQVKQHIRQKGFERAKNAGDFQAMEKIILETENDMKLLDAAGYSWYEDPMKVGGDSIGEIVRNAEYISGRILGVEEFFHASVVKGLEKKYSFRIEPVLELQPGKSENNPEGKPIVTYKLATSQAND